MVQRINRVRNLLVNDTAVTDEVVSGNIMTENFEGTWPTTAILIKSAATPFDEQTEQQDISFSTRCYAGNPGTTSTVGAESLHQIIRTSLTGRPEFGLMTPEIEAVQKPIWATQGILRITEEVGGQPLNEPHSQQRGRPFVLATYRAEFKSA